MRKYLCQESVKFWKHLLQIQMEALMKKTRFRGFKDQLLSFKRIIVAPQRGFGLPKIHYSGKSSGGRDDW